MKRVASILLLILLLVTSLFFVNGIPFRQQAEITSSPAASSDPARENLNNLNNNEKKIMQAVGKIPYLTDVLFDTGEDGKMIVVSVAELNTSPDPDKKNLARQVAHQYMTAVYGTGLNIGGASIHITVDNQLVLGASLGSRQEKKMIQSALTGSGVGEFIQFLKKNENQSTDPEASTWIYEVP